MNSAERFTTTFACAAFVCVSSSMSIALAQSAWVHDSPDAGAPLVLIRTPLLGPGHTYWIETTDLAQLPGFTTWPDTLLSVRTTSYVDDAVTLGGADACGSDLARSCAFFRLPTTGLFSYTTPTAMSLWVWAYSDLAAGTATVRIRECQTSGGAACSTGTPAPTDQIYCSSTTTIATNCWTRLAQNASFGGVRVPLGTPAIAVQLETSLRPGGYPAGYGTYPAGQYIFFSPGSATTNAWNLLTPVVGLPFPGAACTHRRGVACTAQFSGPAPPSTQYVHAAPFSAIQRGNYRLLRNDRVVDNAGTVLGTDNDGDTIGAELETLLNTCDSTAGTSASGLVCNILEGCALPTSARCYQSLRDSDQDGYRDDLELYGYGRTSTGAWVLDGWLPRYGADPAHEDVFLEVDHWGDQLCAPVAGIVNGCCNQQTGALVGSWMTPQDFYGLAATYHRTGTTTPAGMGNRDFVSGVSWHVDVGPYVMAAAATDPSYDPTQSVIGDWGGSRCAFNQCTSTSDCAVGARGGGTCVNNVCTGWNARGQVAASRRWLFRNVTPQPNMIGTCGATDMWCNVDPTGRQIAHEEGHAAGVGHEGPGTAEPGVVGNNLFLHPSQANYLYDNDVESNLMGPIASQVSFSDGSGGVLRSFDMAETVTSGACPFGAVSRYASLDLAINSSFGARGPLAHSVAMGGYCPSVDWNLDGVFAPAGETVEGRVLGQSEAFSGRTQFDNNTRQWSSMSGAEVAVFGTSTLAVVDIVGDSTGTHGSRIRIRSGTSFSCPTTPAASGPRFGSCPIVSGAVAGGTIFTESGVPIAASSVAVAATTAGGANQLVVVYARSSDQRLRSFVLSSIPTGGTAAVTTSYVSPVTEPSRPPFISAGLPTGSSFISLARVGGTSSSVLLLFRRDDGRLLELSGVVVGSAVTWSSAPTPTVTAALAPTSPSVIPLESTSLQIGTTPLANGNLVAMARLGFQVLPFGTFPPAVTIWHRNGVTGVWTNLFEVNHAFDTLPFGRSALALRAYRVGGTTGSPVTAQRLMVATNLGPTLGGIAYLSPPNHVSGTWAGPWTIFAGAAGSPRVTATSIATDSRFSSQSVRGVTTTALDCASPGCTCPAGSTPTALFTTTPACVTPEGLVQSYQENLEPFADGFMPIEWRDLNEWQQMRWTLCYGARIAGPVPASVPADSTATYSADATIATCRLVIYAR